MPSYTYPVDLQLPESPRLKPQGKEDIYGEFQTVYNAIRNLLLGLQGGVPGAVNWGSIGGDILNQTDLIAYIAANAGDQIYSANGGVNSATNVISYTYFKVSGGNALSSQ